MIEKAITRIALMADQAREKIEEIDGIKYLRTSRGLDKIKLLSPDTLSTNTLDSFAQYMDTGDCPDEIGDNAYLCVSDPTTVDLMMTRDAHKNNNLLVRSKYHGSEFQFGRFFPVQEFIINVQTHFVDDLDKKKVIDFVSSVKGETVVTAEDDGISQVVGVVDKVGRISNEKTEPIVELRPYRTFHEVTQPSSKFLLRLDKEGGETTASLYEVDCGAWKLEAIKSIREYLLESENIKKNEVKVIG